MKRLLKHRDELANGTDKLTVGKFEFSGSSETVCTIAKVLNSRERIITSNASIFY